MVDAITERIWHGSNGRMNINLWIVLWLHCSLLQCRDKDRAPIKIREIYLVMNNTQLNKLSHQELVELQVKIAAIIGKKREQERAAVKEKISKLAASSGFDVKELLGVSRGKGSRAKVAIKYANPKDPGQTWTGRGRKPLWIVAELKRGKKLESFTI